MRIWELGFEEELGFCKIDGKLGFLRSLDDQLAWLDLNLGLNVALDYEIIELPCGYEYGPLESRVFG